MPSVQLGDLRVLGFFVPEHEAIKFCPPEKFLSDENAEPKLQRQYERTSALAGHYALVDRAFKIFPERQAHRYFCERFFTNGDYEVGHVLAFADNCSRWHEDTMYHPLKKQLEDVRDKIGLSSKIMPRWHRVVA